MNKAQSENDSPRGFDPWTRKARAADAFSNINFTEAKAWRDGPVRREDSSPKSRPASAPDTSGGVAALARLRARNAYGRIATSVPSALIVAAVVEHWAPLAWLACVFVVLFLERRFANALARASERGEARIGGYLVWTFLQSLTLNALAAIAWFMEPRHGDALAAFYLAAGALNALVTLRAVTPLMLAGLSATSLTMLALPIVDYAVSGNGRPFVEFGPLMAVVMFGVFGFYIWRTLREADAVHVRATASAVRAERLSREASSARADFVALMKHEVRTPMMALSGSAEILRRVSLPPEARVQVDALLASGDVLAAVLDDLVDLDAIESGRLAIQPRRTDPRTMIRSVVDAFRTEAEDKGLELFVDVAETTPDAVMIDPVRVRQILFNLISNAVRFTPSGGVRVRLQAAPSEKAGHVRLGVSVADTGVGMSRTELAGYLADRRAGAGRKGLGLAICAKLARLMGAKLGARSTPGQGSMFSFVIDAELCAKAEMKRRAGPRFLVVQHRAPERREIAAILEATGVTFDFAEDGARGLEMLHEARYDLVIADHEAPEFDAADIAELLKQGGLNAATPVIALVSSDAVRAHCLEAGVDGCVMQPLSPPALLDEISLVLGAPLSANWAA